MKEKKKLIRVTTSDISLESLIKGQMRFLSTEFEVVGVSNNTGVLEMVGRREGVRTIEIPMHREISLKDDVHCVWLLYKLFKKERPYIVHANTPKGSLLSMIAAKMARVPHRLYLVTGLRYQGAHGLFRWLLMTMERITCACANKVIPEGQGVLHALQIDHITSKPLKVIHNGNINGIDTSYFSREATEITLKQSLFLSEGSSPVEVRQAMRQSIGLKDEDFAFIFIGRIIKDKGMHELVKAMRALTADIPQCRLILVGNFEQELDPLPSDDVDYLEHDEHVKFVGYQTDVRPYLLASDALVFPSYREGFPNVVLQAGAMGIPSLVTNISGCNEIVEDGHNGKIIAAPLEVGTEQMEKDLVSTMRYFLEHRAEVNRMAANSRQMITSRYEQADVWQALLQMYQELGD